MVSIYNIRLAAYVEEGDQMEMPVIFSPHDFSYILPRYRVNGYRNLHLWKNLKTPTKKLKGFNKVKVVCLREPWKLTLNDLIETKTVTSSPDDDPCTVFDNTTFYVGKTMEKKDFRRGVKYVPAKEALDALRRAREKEMKEVIMSVAGRRISIGKEVGIAADYFLERKPVKVPAVS